MLCDIEEGEELLVQYKSSRAGLTQSARRGEVGRCAEVDGKTKAKGGRSI
jgi:hypothetical protein